MRRQQQGGKKQGALNDRRAPSYPTRPPALSAPARPAAQLGRLANPVASQRAQRLPEIAAAHRRYCEKQLENDKTRWAPGPCVRALFCSFGRQQGRAGAWAGEHWQ